MKRLFLLCLSVWVVFSAFAKNLDSLQLVWETAQFATESEKVQVLTLLAEAYMSATPESRYPEAITLLETEEEKLGFNVPELELGRYYAALGRAYYYKDSYEGTADAKEKSPFYYEKAIPFLAKARDSLELAEAMLNGGTMILYNDKSKAFAYFQEAANIFRQHKVVEREISCYGQLCTVLSALGKVDEALGFSRKVLDLIPQIEDYYNVAQVCTSIGIVYMDAKKYKYAEGMFDQALQAAHRGEDQFLMATSKMYLGANKVDNPSATPAELAQGKAALDAADKLFEALENEYVREYLNVYYASYFCGVQDYEEALARSSRYLNYMKDSGQEEVLALIYSQRGKILLEMSALDSAEVYYQKAVELAEGTENDFFLENAYQKLYKISKENKNFEQALAYHELYLIHHDTIYNQRLQNIMGTEGVKLDLAGEQRARKNAELQAQLLTSRNQLFGAIALGLLGILFIGGYLYRQLQNTRKQLERQNIQLKQLNATKDKFFGIIAHDIRSPITALDGVGEQMTYYLSKNDHSKLERLAGRIDVTTKRLAGLLDNLLNWALIQTGMIPYHPDSIFLKEVVDEILDLFQPLAEAKKINLTNAISLEVKVYADERALHTIIRNLVSNALKFTPENGTISLSAKEEDRKAFIEINDTGTGIHAEKLRQLFTLEKKSVKGTAGEKGTGLGLMLCKELVELNKGSIKVFSELGEGSKFIFSVPAQLT